jgi:hypothetical protein
METAPMKEVNPSALEYKAVLAPWAREEPPEDTLRTIVRIDFAGSNDWIDGGK